MRGGGGRRRPLGRHHGGRRQHARQGANRLLAGLAQRLERGTAGRIDVEGDGDVTAARRDAADHPGGQHAAAACWIDDCLKNLADSRFGDFRHVVCFRRLAIFCRRLIAGVAAVTYMQPDVKAKR